MANAQMGSTPGGVEIATTPGGGSGGGGITTIASAGGTITVTNPGGPITNVEVADNAVTNAKLADMAQATIKGRAAGAGTGDPQDLTGAQVNLILPVATQSLAGLESIADKIKLDQQEVLIDAQALSAVATYTSPTWANGTYRAIRLELDYTSCGGTIALTLTGPATTAFVSSGLGTNGFAYPWTSVVAAQLSVFPTTPNKGVCNGTFTVADNAMRGGTFLSNIVDNATSLAHNHSTGGWICTDTTTDVTGFALQFSAAFTGNVRVWGQPL